MNKLFVTLSISFCLSNNINNQCVILKYLNKKTSKWPFPWAISCLILVLDSYAHISKKTKLKYYQVFLYKVEQSEYLVLFVIIYTLSVSFQSST